jgi:hypothetical protein
MLKKAILPLKTPFSGTLKMNNQYLTVARPQASKRYSHLLASAHLTEIPLWTADKRLKSGANQLELTFK